MTFSKKILSAALCLSAMAIVSQEAWAGFNWTPSPHEKAGMQTKVVTPQGENALGENGPLTPDPDAVLAAPVGDVQTQDLSVQPATPVTLSDESDVSSMPVPAPAQPAGVLEGFGSDIPLALALRDIVPAGYAYAFSNPADAGQRVSWNGGKVWQDVLADTLSPLNLTFAISGNAVQIFSSQGVTAPTPVLSVPQNEEVAPVDETAAVPLTPEAQSEAPVVSESSAPSQTEMPVIKSSMKRTWTARPGSTLREVVEEWSKAAGVEVEWMSPYDYPISNAFTFEGTYDKAITSLLSQYSRETPRPRGRLYPNLPTGPSVLMVN